MSLNLSEKYLGCQADLAAYCRLWKSIVDIACWNRMHIALTIQAGPHRKNLGESQAQYIDRHKPGFK